MSIKRILPALLLTVSLGACTAYGPMDCPPYAHDHRDCASHHDRVRMDHGMSMTGDADVDFARNMIPHHQDAVDMAEVELSRGTDPYLRTMAHDIIVTQKREITLLRDWLKRNGAY